MAENRDRSQSTRQNRERSQRARQTTKTNASRKKAALRKKRRRQVIRNRIIALTIIIVAIVAVIAVIVTRFSSDTETEEVAEDEITETQLTLNADGSVTLIEVDSFDEEYYDEDELTTYIEELVTAYNDENGVDSVTIDSIEVKKKKGTASVITTYATVEDYAAFTGSELVSGTVVNLKETYAFDTPFVEVVDGEKGDTISKNDITAQDDLNVLIIRQNIRVTVPGEILYVTEESTTIFDEQTIDIIQIDGNEDATQEIYIMY